MEYAALSQPNIKPKIARIKQLKPKMTPQMVLPVWLETHGDKVGAAGGADLSDGSAQTRDHAAKNDEHDLVAQNGRQDVEEQRREHDLHHREDDEALANAAPA